MIWNHSTNASNLQREFRTLCIINASDYEQDSTSSTTDWFPSGNLFFYLSNSSLPFGTKSERLLSVRSLLLNTEFVSSWSHLFIILLNRASLFRKTAFLLLNLLILPESNLNRTVSKMHHPALVNKMQLLFCSKQDACFDHFDIHSEVGYFK